MSCQHCESPSAALAPLSVNRKMPNLDIDPEGDIVLILQDVKLQVSSRVWSLASPVSKAMFGPHFAEGPPTSNRTRRIVLQDDDAEAMGVMCNVLHPKYCSWTPIGLDCLEKVAILTDIYDYIRAMYYWAKCEIFVSKDTEEHARLLSLAYAFDEAIFFHNLTKFLVFHYPNASKVLSTSERYAIREEIENYLPSNLLGKLPKSPPQFSRQTIRKRGIPKC